jgi:hypothetical protein
MDPWKVPVRREVPSWWPPKVGDKLRYDARQLAGRSSWETLLHVLSVFEDKDGEQRIVTAEWLPGKRWNYAVFWWYQAALGTIWPDGTRRPEPR